MANTEFLIKLIKLANNNPNDNEANAAARKVCQLIEEDKFSCIKNIIPAQNFYLYNYYEAMRKQQAMNNLNDFLRYEQNQYISFCRKCGSALDSTKKCPNGHHA